MIRTAAMCALALGVAACGDGNPFTADETVTTPTPTPTAGSTSVPAAILNDLERIDFDAATNTLVVTGLTQEGVPLANSYRHVATSFVNGYETFTAQNDPLGRHATAFVASRDGGLQAGVVLTGPQFNKFFGGTFFERTGSYEAPIAPDSRFDVTYYGNYAGGLNTSGPVTDLFPTIGLDPDIDVPQQTAYIRGLMFVNVDLVDMSVEGEIYDRTGVFRDPNNPTTPIFGDFPDLVLVGGTLNADGTFSGDLEVDSADGGIIGNDVGDFAGVIGGPGGNALAGGLTATDFNDLIDDEIEYGVFVLDLCTTASTDPVCINALAP